MQKSEEKMFSEENRLIDSCSCSYKVNAIYFPIYDYSSLGKRLDKNTKLINIKTLIIILSDKEDNKITNKNPESVSMIAIMANAMLKNHEKFDDLKEFVSYLMKDMKAFIMMRKPHQVQDE
jgi:hypothetical protein